MLRVDGRIVSHHWVNDVEKSKGNAASLRPAFTVD